MQVLEARAQMLSLSLSLSLPLLLPPGGMPDSPWIMDERGDIHTHVASV